MKITVRIYSKNKLIARRIGNRANWKKLYGKLASAGARKALPTRYSILVEYGKEKDTFGRDEAFTNSYDGNSLPEAKEALSAFIELEERR